jgi:hypothetical protein
MFQSHLPQAPAGEINSQIIANGVPKSLDTMEFQGYSVRLFYSGKKLCLELSREGHELAVWTFCSQRRHTWSYSGADYTINVSYRPAEVEVRFTERSGSSALARLFRLAPPQKEMWAKYKLGGDGAVKISRPDKEFSVC